MLTAIDTSDNRSWQDSIGEVQLAINWTMNRTTKASPLELLIGKVARPLSLMCSSDEENDVDIDKICKVTSDNIKCAEYDKSRFDMTKAKVNSFSVGDFVLFFEERNQTKLDPKFKGPFKVVEVLEGDRYTLKALNCKRSYKYAHDRLRKMPEGHVPVEIDLNDELVLLTVDLGK